MEPSGVRVHDAFPLSPTPKKKKKKKPLTEEQIRRQKGPMSGKNLRLSE